MCINWARIGVELEYKLGQNWSRIFSYFRSKYNQCFQYELYQNCVYFMAIIGVKYRNNWSNYLQEIGVEYAGPNMSKLQANKNKLDYILGVNVG